MFERHRLRWTATPSSPGFVNGRAEIHHQFRPHHFQQMKAGLPRGRGQIRAGVALKMHDMQIRIDHQRGRRVVFEQSRFRFLTEIDGPPGAEILAGAAFGPGKRPPLAA